ncbi:MAG TPA: cell surface protein SprA, partial [Bacteroidia bacterium]|nr:cell surface protein SprA [Bacteroidia bacterium]
MRPATFYIPKWNPIATNPIVGNVIDTTKTNKPTADSNKTAQPEDSDVVLPYPFDDHSTFGDPLGDPNGGLILSDPSNIHEDVQFDPVTGQYVVTQKMGSLDYRDPVSLDSTDYMNYVFNKQVKDYWKTRTHQDAQEQRRGIIPKIHIKGKMFDRIFGGNTVDIRPQGSAELIFAANTSRTQNPALPVNQRTISTFNFNEKIQLNVIGNIGDKLKLTTNYNTQATFDFENQMKLEYTGHEDEIIKKIDAGNVSLPLNGSLITGSQSLFGIKTELQFGALTATSIFSQEKGQKSEIDVTGGAQTTNFSFSADNYEANKHYFLSQYFRNTYQAALANLPIVTSGINITKIEVWVTNTTGSTSNIRNILAMSDLGESGTGNLTSPGFVFPVVATPNGIPSNTANTLNPSTFAAAHPGVLSSVNAVSTLQGLGFKITNDFEFQGNARLLAPTEYTFNPKLGYISLTQPLNYSQVLAVAYQYTVNGQTYQVGTFSTDQAPPNNLMVKMLKSTNVSVKVPIWNLMMKNIYSLGAYQINPQKFTLNVVYNNPGTGTNIPYIPQGSLNGKPLIQVLDLDNLNSQMDKQPDGNFDYVEGITIISSTGTIIFPVLEPFGSYLLSRFTPAEQTTIGPNDAFPQLYDSTLTSAPQFPNLDRFTIQGSYQSSSSSDISLNTVNVPQGSVTVTAGGVKLTENVDYTVDYTLGRVKIINQGILNSGVPIKISLESNSLFSIQSKTLLGTHLDYRVSNDLDFGATILNLTEKPLTTKVNIGDEPISNTIFGFDGSYKTKAPFLTRMVDAIPLINTKAPSSITATGEFADLIPGHPSVIGKDGTSYIDDFEGAESEIDLKSSYAWTLASTPTSTSFPEGNLSNNLDYGFNRAKFAWYTIDPLFQVYTTNLTPLGIGKPQMSNNFTRQILQTEIFPNIQSSTGQPQPLPTLDLAFYPTQRGPYNYDVNPTTVSSGVAADGSLLNPTSRWGGIMRALQTNDFEAANIDFVQFWVMDPFNSDNTTPNTTGALYVDLGDVSEDILKDGRMSYENGLPTNAADAADSANGNNPYSTTVWGRVPNNMPLINAFSSDPNARPYQDVGLDGLSDADERTFFASYLSALAAKVGGTGSQAYINAQKDPSSDDYHYYRGDDYDGANTSILNRYLNYNGKDGNSPTQAQYQSLNSGGYPTTGTTIPD